MIECSSCFSIGVTSQAGGTVICISSDPLMFTVHFPLRMAGGGTGELPEITRIGMAIRTSIPFPVMIS